MGNTMGYVTSINIQYSDMDNWMKELEVVIEDLMYAKLQFTNNTNLNDSQFHADYTTLLIRVLNNIQDDFSSNLIGEIMGYKLNVEAVKNGFKEADEVQAGTLEEYINEEFGH